VRRLDNIPYLAFPFERRAVVIPPAIFRALLPALILITGLGFQAKHAGASGRHISRPSRTRFGLVRLDTAVPDPVHALHARAAGTVAPQSTLLLTLGLPLHNEAALNAFIETQAIHGRYLSQSQFDARFGAPLLHVARVEHWARGQGFRVLYVSPDRLTITVQGTAARAAAAFRVHLDRYRLGSRMIFANSTDPKVPASLGLQTVTGLDNIQTPEVVGLHRDDVPSNGYLPSNLRAAYDLGSNDASGQTIGAVLWGSPVSDSDFAAFAKLTGDPKLVSCTGCRGPDRIQWIQVKHKNKDHDLGEQALDAEYLHGMAPHSHIKFFLGGDGSNAGLELAMARAASDPSIHIVSDSWGVGGVRSLNKRPFIRQTTNTLKHAVAVGTTFYFSTGDAGANSGCNNPAKSCGLASYPADSPYVVAVGGTDLQMDPTFTSWQGEEAWSVGSNGSSGGGCASFISRPSWQRDVASATCKGRAIPDISAIADVANSPAIIWVKGSSQLVGGTSLSAPVIAGLAADTDAYLAHRHLPLMGFAAPKLYSLARSNLYHAYFHDVVCGSNYYPAGPGWDQVTGWGTPDWAALTRGFGGEPVDPVTFPTTWSCATDSGTVTDLRAVSCADRFHCGAAGNSGRLLDTSTGWRWIRPSTKVGRLNFAGIACPSDRVCDAVTTSGRLFTTTDGGKKYRSRQLATRSATGISCPASKTCYVSTLRQGVIKIAGSSLPKRENVRAVAGVIAIRCPTLGTCYGLEPDGNIVKTGNGSTWKSYSTGLTINATFSGIACSAVARCYAVGTTQPPLGKPSGIILTTRDGKTWSSQLVNGLPKAVACTGLSRCETAGADGSVLRTINGSSWQPVTFTPDLTVNFAGISCSSSRTCFAVGAKGQILTLNVSH